MTVLGDQQKSPCRKSEGFTATEIMEVGCFHTSARIQAVTPVPQDVTIGSSATTPEFQTIAR